MRRSWLLIITKGLRVWMPPELYLEKRTGAQEARRWVETLSRRRPPEDLQAATPFQLRGQVVLHLIEGDFMEPWRACPLWVCVRWSERSYPRITAELLVADAGEAADWVRGHARSALVQRADSERAVESTFQRRGITAHVAAHRLKRLNGF